MAPLFRSIKRVKVTEREKVRKRKNEGELLLESSIFKLVLFSFGGNK